MSVCVVYSYCIVSCWMCWMSFVLYNNKFHLFYLVENAINNIVVHEYQQHNKNKTILDSLPIGLTTECSFLLSFFSYYFFCYRSAHWKFSACFYFIWNIHIFDERDQHLEILIYITAQRRLTASAHWMTSIYWMDFMCVCVWVRVCLSLCVGVEIEKYSVNTTKFFFSWLKPFLSLHMLLLLFLFLCLLSSVKSIAFREILKIPVMCGSLFILLST